MISRQEKDSFFKVLWIAKEHGYGNMISFLKRAWIDDLTKNGLDEEAAMIAADTDPYPKGFIENYLLAYDQEQNEE